MDPNQDQPIQDTTIAPVADDDSTDYQITGETEDELEDLNNTAEDAYAAAEESTKNLKEMQDDYDEVKKLYDEAMGSSSAPTETPSSNEPVMPSYSEIPQMPPVTSQTEPLAEVPMTPVADTPAPMMESITPTEQSAPQMPWQQNPNSGQTTM